MTVKMKNKKKPIVDKGVNDYINDPFFIKKREIALKFIKKAGLPGNISLDQGNINFQVPVISFIDDNKHIIYCPALDLSGYGNNETEARKSLDIVIEGYL